MAPIAAAAGSPAPAAPAAGPAASLAWAVLRAGPRLGLVVPKRLARRSVTRNLVKRQARVAFGRHQQALPAGDWVLRLRAPIDAQRYPSAASQALRALLRDELAALFARWPTQPPSDAPTAGASERGRP